MCDNKEPFKEEIAESMGLNVEEFEALQDVVGERMERIKKDYAWEAYQEEVIDREEAARLIGEDELEEVEEYLDHRNEPDDVRLYE